MRRRVLEHPLRVAPLESLEKEQQDNCCVIRFRGDVKLWPPSVDMARPASCPKCRVACGMRGARRIYGHGVVERQQRGPPGPDEASTCQVVVCRRFFCLECRTVIRVLPAAAQPRKHFSGAAIALALAAWGLCAMSLAEVRRRVNDAREVGSSVRGWRTLTAWTGDVSRGVLFAGLGLTDGPGAPRAVAARAAQALVGWAPPTWAETAVTHQAFAGSVHVG